MPIPTWCLILGGIVLFVAFILSIKIRLVLLYEDDFSVYIKILFFKITIYPENKKKKNKEKTDKKSKKDTKKSKEASTEKKEKSEHTHVIKIITAMKDTIGELISAFFGKLHFKFLKIYADIGCDDAAKTALAYGAVSQSIAYAIDFLSNVSNVDMTRSSDIDVRANFISQKSWVELNCELYLRVLPALSLGIKALKAFFKFKSIQEKLSEVDNNGTIKTK